MSKAACSRCGDPLAAELAASGVHVLCCDPTCDRWPCDGTHRPGQPVTGSLSDFKLYPHPPRETGGWCVGCGNPVDVPDGACSPLCMAKLAHKLATVHYDPREVWS